MTNRPMPGLLLEGGKISTMSQEENMIYQLGVLLTHEHVLEAMYMRACRLTKREVPPPLG